MLSRRQIISSPLAAGLALASRKATAQSAKRIIVDAQVHLWKAESEDWKWVPGTKPQLPEPFTIENLVPLMDQAGVDRVVIVPPSWGASRSRIRNRLRWCRNGRRSPECSESVSAC